MSNGDDFESVLRAARAGAEWAWSRLYADLAPALISFLRARGAPEPEDVLAETFLQVVRDLERFDGDEAGWRSWVFTIAYRRLIDDRRSRSRRPASPTDDDSLAAQMPPGSGVEADALENLATEDVLRLFDRLTDDQRTVLSLHFMGGLTLSEVGRVIGRNTNATKALHHRGLRALRRHLQVSDP